LNIAKRRKNKVLANPALLRVNHPELSVLSPASWLRSLPPAAVCGSSEVCRLTQTHATLSFPSQPPYPSSETSSNGKASRAHTTQVSALKVIHPQKACGTLEIYVDKNAEV